MNGGLTARSGAIGDLRPTVTATARRNTMQAALPLVALATGAALPSPLRAVHEALVNGKPAGAAVARGSKGKVTAVLPARLQEDVRVVGALAELFATAAAERLMNDGLTLDSDEAIYPRPSNDPKRNVMGAVLPLIALTTGAALCGSVLAPRVVVKRDRAATKRRNSRRQTKEDT